MGGAELFESSIGIYLDNGYLLPIRNSAAAKTLSAIKTAKICTDILELEKLVIEKAGNEHAISSIIRIIDGLSQHVGNIEESLCVELDLWNKLESSLSRHQTEWASRLLIKHKGFKIRNLRVARALMKCNEVVNVDIIWTRNVTIRNVTRY